MAGVIQKWKTSPPCPAHLNLIELFKEEKCQKKLKMILLVQVVPLDHRKSD
ncbi:hypothetical protein DAPPUDRAFT_253038 [Daphnia pulex]|uniref:Uncharacterized protein n=1 Tax=Daphnia pulex TaxID=6669 RepID=E9H420_DAPPU|nr:hypothetical protein DAPPUDRAFT_253038 [Daphnia pulex]|eukprot:EFX73439.1 hypothetical protein DAPPUDRAFT_253038 [Daphnia pulex]